MTPEPWTEGAQGPFSEILPVPVGEAKAEDRREPRAFDYPVGGFLPRPIHRVWLWEPDRRDAFRDGLIDLITMHGADGETDTPDYVLADYLIMCMNAFDDARARRDVCRS